MYPFCSALLLLNYFGTWKNWHKWKLPAIFISILTGIGLLSFFLAVDPDFAVASCGTDNDYGHPHLETLSLLYETHTAFYRTDCDGTITFRLDGTRVSVDPIRKENP